MIIASLMRAAHFALVLLLTCQSPRPVQTLELGDVKNALSRGQVLLMRHASAPGGGDPSNFKVTDCSTQRNLGSDGRAHSQQIGADMRYLGLNVSRVLSSRWCRCLDTAKLMDVGTVEPVEFLGSFYQAPPIGVPKASTVAALRQHLATEVGSSDGVQLMVTHYVTVKEITGHAVSEGTMVLYDPVSKKSHVIDTAKVDRSKYSGPEPEPEPEPEPGPKPDGKRTKVLASMTTSSAPVFRPAVVVVVGLLAYSICLFC
jgi:phosphohistidine phosphatase SixA